MSFDATAIPAALRQRAQWVVWRFENDTKVPYNARTGRMAQSNNPRTWTTFEESLATFEKGGYTGLGYVFTENDPFTGIDLDDCIDDDGQTASWANHIIDSMQSYSEVSPSGSGVKIWVEGEIPASIKVKPYYTGGIEIYDRERYFAVTGISLGYPRIRNVNGELDVLYQQVQKAKELNRKAPLDAPRAPVNVPTIDPYTRKALEENLAELRSTKIFRNNMLNDKAYRMGRFVGGGLITRAEVEPLLIEAGIRSGLTPDETRRTTNSGLNAGMRAAPIVRPERPASLIKGVPDEVLQDEDLMSQVREAHLTDAGNAEVFELLHRDLYRYDRSRKQWLEWNGDRWLPDADAAVMRATVHTARLRQAATHGIENLEKRQKHFNFAMASEDVKRATPMLIRARSLEMFNTTIEQYDRNNWLAGVKGGTLDLNKQIVRASVQGEYITQQLGTAYDPAATCPRWLTFLVEVFGGDTELIGYIQRAVGYSLTGDTREQKMFLCFGGGENGKSVLLEVIAQLMGDYAGSAAFDTFDAGRKTEQTADLASLKGKRFISVIESDEDRRLAEARVKAVTGQDPIKCRFLYGQPFEYRPTFKLWMAMNHKPIIRGSDHGIWRRVRLIPFMQNFEGRADKTLGSYLIENELPGILNWALDGLRDWQQHGLGTAGVIDNATQEYRRESDIVAQWLDECCVEEPGAETTPKALYQSYREWCKDYGYREPTENALGRALTEKGYPKGHDSSGKRVRHGLRIGTSPNPTTFSVGDVGADQRNTTQANAFKRAGNYDKAREYAYKVHGRKEQAALLHEIDDAEQGTR